MLEKTLDSSMDSKEIKTVNPKEINLEYSLEGLMLKLELQYFGHLIRRAYSLEKTLMLGKIECRRRRGGQRMRWWMASMTQWTWVWANSGREWRTGKPGTLQSMGSQRVGHGWATELKYIYDRILLSHKKEWNWVICSDVDGPRVCHTKSEREK